MQELLDRSLRGDIQVETAFPDELWPIRIDVVEFELVVLNLCVNARDAMPDGGTILLSGRNCLVRDDEKPPTDFVVLMITDTGTGMSPEVIAHAFEPFFTTKDIGKGSGLGLAQAYGFAKSSGGKVEIESEIGRGTTVSVFLPRSVDVVGRLDDQPTDRVVDQVPKCDDHSLHVLLVEDDEDVAAFAVEMLSEIGHSVTRVASAQAALGAISDGRAIDLVFSDIMMPGGMNGIQLAVEIGRRRPNLPILLTSGHATPYFADARKIDAHILAKPYSIKELEDAIHTRLSG
jgi:CheY-like chemotaxis protein